MFSGCRLLFLLGVLFAAGCGETGSVGDTNDPATTTDVEQMADETDAAINSNAPGTSEE
jgi:hypothetical protein